MKESGNDEAFDQELTRLLLSFMMEEPLVTPNDSDHLSWQKTHDVIVPIIKEQTLMQVRLSLDKENQELVTFVEEHTPPTSKLGKTQEKEKIQEASETYVIKFEYCAPFEKCIWMNRKIVREDGDNGFTNRLKQSVDPPILKLNNSCHRLFHWRPKRRCLKLLLLVRARRRGHMKVTNSKTREHKSYYTIDQLIQGKKKLVKKASHLMNHICTYSAWIIPDPICLLRGLK